MDGMEKITARIQEDADREIAAMNARTDEQIAALQAQAQAQADKERGEILARGGFILVDGPVVVNCSFESMLRLQRE